MNTKSKGNLTEVKILAILIELGYNVSIPWGENCSYDLILDKGGSLYRVQCKTGRYKNGSIRFNVGRTYYNAKFGKCVRTTYDKDSIDFFAVYCHELNTAYLVPISNTRAEIALRVDAMPINQSDWHKAKLRWAKDYELKRAN